MSFKPVTVFIWPSAQKCFECRNSVECQDTEGGTLSGISCQPFAVCICAEHDSATCKSFNPKGEDL